jgi:Spy/CpxP family protein refolding chaperone
MGKTRAGLGAGPGRLSGAGAAHRAAAWPEAGGPECDGARDGRRRHGPFLGLSDEQREQVRKLMRRRAEHEALRRSHKNRRLGERSSVNLYLTAAGELAIEGQRRASRGGPRGSTRRSGP